MTSLENRPRTALLVIDVQKGVVENAYQRDSVIANIAALVEKSRPTEEELAARRAAVPVKIKPAYPPPKPKARGRAR